MNSNLDGVPEDVKQWLFEQLLGDRDADLGEVDGDSRLPIQDAPSDLRSQIGDSMLDFVDEEVPAVRDRYLAIMEARLTKEAEHRPLLFPWESEVQDYPDFVDEPNLRSVPSFLKPHLLALQTPTVFPEAVLAHLLDRCQAIAGQVAQEGRALIDAVEALFPGEEAQMNRMAGMVLTTATRTAAATPAEIVDYDSAPAQRKIALAMMAAKELFGSLKLELSAENNTDNRQWLTAFGILSLDATYDAANQSLRIDGELPCAGQLALEAPDGRTVAERDDAGRLTVQWSAARPKNMASLVVTFSVDADLPPLRFTTLVV